MFVSKLEFAQHKRQVIRIIEMQRLKLKLLEKEIKINSIDARIQLSAIAAIQKPSEMSDTDYVLKINEKMNELWSEEALIRQGAKIKQELLEIQKILDELEKQGDMQNGRNRKILRDNRSLCVAMGRKHKHNNRGYT